MPGIEQEATEETEKFILSLLSCLCSLLFKEAFPFTHA
jgi:hypothetical protein